MKKIISFEKTGRQLRSAATGAVLWLAADQAAMPAVAQASDSLPYTFITLAEKAVRDGSGEKLATVRNTKPNSLAVDAKGDIYFTDSRHQVICRMTAAGSISIVAGKRDTIGSADGKGEEARFYYPHGIALDATGDLYVADSHNDTIRRITPAGVVTTVAGKAGAPGEVDGTGKAARFNYPSDIAVDRSGTLYVADLYNFVVRKVTPGGLVTTLAGQMGESGSKDGAAREAEFDSPFGIAADDRGNVYVADVSKNAIRKITASGKVVTLAGQPSYQPGHADGKGRAAQFFHPYGLAADGAGNIYVADSDNHLIRRIAPDGTAVTLAGLAGTPGNEDGTGNETRFGHPFRIALDAEGNLYVTDLDNWAIRKGMPEPPANAALALTGR